MERLIRSGIVVAGILAGQFYLYGPALIGRQLLLPLDLLAAPGFYLPQISETEAIKPRDMTSSDLVTHAEPTRWFTAAEIRAGRWPLWSPYAYGGAPFLGIQWSPFQVLYVLWPNPRILAWMQALTALVAGVGAYRCCRSVLGTGFWPAAVVAWCYPLSGFFVLWHGHTLPHSAAFFPWMLWATDAAVRNPLGYGGAWLAICTAASIGCGAVDISGQSLIICGCYVLMRGGEIVWQRGFRSVLPSVLVPVCGWGLGFLLAAAMLLPMVEYLRTGARFQDRAHGVEERPPIGLSALPLVIAPELQGVTRPGSLFIGQGNVPESAAAGYAGLIAACLLAPLALCRRTDRWQIAFWSFCALLGLSWSLNLPGFVQLFRLPLLNSLSYNRFVFITGWSILGLAAIGLDVLWRSLPERRWWFLIPALGAALLGFYFLAGSVALPEPLATKLELGLRSGRSWPHVSNLEDLRAVQRWFANSYFAAAIICAVVCLSWGMIASRRIAGKLLFAAFSIALIVELLRFAGPWPLMADTKWYYPPVHALDQLAGAPAGRVLGVECLPPKIGERYKFQDLRGYDAVDPSGIIDLLDLARDTRFTSPRYARTQFFVPNILPGPDDVRLPGVLNMLNVRYLIFRGEPLPKIKPRLIEDDYWVWENPDALPRVYVPARIERSPPRNTLMQKLAHREFDAARLSYADFGREYAKCIGLAQIVREHPQEIVIEADMQTPGVVVLADSWYAGWQAELNENSVPILRVNHAVRGVEVPAGRSTIVMRYRPASFTRGLWISIISGLICLAWFVGILLVTHRTTLQRATLPA